MRRVGPKGGDIVAARDSVPRLFDRCSVHPISDAKGDIMTRIIAALALTLLLQAAIATAGDLWGGDRWGTDTGSSYSHSRNSDSGPHSVQIRDPFDRDPTNHYSGWRSSDGYTRAHDFNGNTLTGTIDNDGYGRMRDQDGNTHRVRAR